MNQRIYGRAIVAGAAGIAVKDLILQGAVALGWARYNLWAVLAQRYSLAPTAGFLSQAVVGLSLHVAIGVMWALLWAGVLRTGCFANFGWVMLGLANTVVIWMGWGITFPLLRLGPAPWSLGFSTTIITLFSDLGYSLVTARGLTRVSV
ncbi:MAG TPA: hypothetical protein GX513_11765 [Firmicutes bacterium]|nr:hypothetical protein [Bacillota bacterium]